MSSGSGGERVKAVVRTARRCKLKMRSFLSYVEGRTDLAFAVASSNWGMIVMARISFAQPNRIQ